MEISASTFIRNNRQGAFCLWESLATFLSIPYITDISIIDLGSDDGTFELLRDIARCNRRVRVYRGSFTCVDAKAFADAANQCVQLWGNSLGVFWQADEIMHPTLVKRFMQDLDRGVQQLAFWRYQLRENFTRIKWYPHPVQRFGSKDMLYTGDGMNTQTVFGVDVCSSYDMGWFAKWGELYKNNPVELPTHEMIMDVSMVGGFLDNIVDRRLLHAPMWHESPTIEGMDAQQWINREKHNPNWYAETTPYVIPYIMRYHVGKTRYEIRTDLIEAIKSDYTDRMVGL